MRQTLTEEESRSFDILYCQYRKGVPRVGWDILVIVGYVDWNESATCQDRDAEEQPGHHAKESKKGDTIEADLVQ